MTAPRSLGAPLVRMGAVTSTMVATRRLESLGAPEGITVVAATQTHGRGRSDRVWQSPTGAGLYCSILLRPNIPVEHFQPFSIAAGLALCDALDPYRTLGIQLKWPNDLVFSDRKLAGILVTTSLSGSQVASAILGFGVNLCPDPAQPATAIALAELIPDELPGRAKMLLRLTSTLSARYTAICSGDPESALEGSSPRLANLGQHVIINDGDTAHSGIVQGISTTGNLILDTPSGPRSISAGELTRGPRPLTSS